MIDRESAPTALGATYLGGGRCRFRVWAPFRRDIEVKFVEPVARQVPLSAEPLGFFSAVIEDVEPGTRYFYRLDRNQDRPDPASRHQPRGVHGPSQVVDPRFPWTDDAWTGLDLEDHVFYEIHIGTFTPEGTFDAVIPRLAELKDLGVTAIELMPVAQFPGPRNWGYDGVFPYAAQNSYGGPDGLRRLVDACHARGLAVVLDVVYNHLGPEGNWLGDYGPYFTDRYRTPWGPAINFDGLDSDRVREYFILNALHWIADFHLDGLRLDALHAIVDPSPRPFLEELAAAVHDAARALGRRAHLIAETDRNDPRFVRPPAAGGLGLDAQWNDDFHHSLHALLTGERSGYYQDFGHLEQMGRAFTDAYVLAGQYSTFRRRRHGRPAESVPARRFVVFSQNHDQVGNRALGDRLSGRVPYEVLKLAAASVILSPYLPLFFMGEEYGETAPFQYFVSHEDPALWDAVRRGRREEFAAFGWGPDLPDPGGEDTFRRCVLNWDLRGEGRHRRLRVWYQHLLAVRRSLPALAAPAREWTAAAVHETERLLIVHRWTERSQALILLHFSGETAAVKLAGRGGTWRKGLDSAEARWDGPGSRAPDSLDLEREATLELTPWSVTLYSLDEGVTEETAMRAAAVTGVTEASGGGSQ